MMLRNVFVFALSFVAALGCSNTQDLGTSPTPASSDSAWSGSAAGTIDGKAFVPTSASAHAGPGYIEGQGEVPVIDLFFSSTPDLCTALRSDQLPAGQTYVQFYDVPPELGSHTVSSGTIAIVDANCPSGTRLDKDNSPASAAHVVKPGATVTFTRIDSERVEGTVSAKFDDLSSFEGSFSVAPCSGGSDSRGFGDSPVCK
jgi:hypothetical protein